jgi:ubiquitin thioesterase OTU1
VMAVCRRVIDADNSCLFNSIGFLLLNTRSKSSELRAIVRYITMQSPEIYSEAVLSKPPSEYAVWIMKDSTWGGEMEVAVLAQYFKVQIAVVDIRTSNVYIYGSESTTESRLFLLYDGIHYDALVKSPSPDTETDSDIKIFSPHDEEMHLSCQAFSKTQKFVDLVGFDLKCLVCGAGLIGQNGAQSHAKSTGHTNFGQIQKLGS